MDHNHKPITNGSFRYGQNHIVTFTEETLMENFILRAMKRVNEIVSKIN